MKDEERFCGSLMPRIISLTVLRKLALGKSLSGENKLYFCQLPFLEYIVENPGCTQAQISSRLGITPASASQSSKRLQKAGFIEKQCDEKNQHIYRIFATEKGKENVKECRAALNAADMQMFRGFDENDYHGLCEYLDRMISNFCGSDNKILDKYALYALSNSAKDGGKSKKMQRKE